MLESVLISVFIIAMFIFDEAQCADVTFVYSYSIPVPVSNIQIGIGTVNYQYIKGIQNLVLPKT